MASSSITPSSTLTLTKKYQVFLSFRGEDTRFGFTSHLYYALCEKCMVTFIDYKLVRGDEISTALLKSIQESMIAVVIFSKDYASSTSCLCELAEIMKREKLRELIVLPVFYNVKPSDVEKQTGPFKDSFAKHENDSPEEVQEWREAFTEASNRAGWDYDGKRSEYELVREIVEDVQNKLMGEIENISPPLYDLGLIGIKNRIKPVLSLLRLGRMDDVQIIGIWGMGGIGKTTLTEVVFNLISGQFDGSCFVAKVGERLENGETNGLQLEVLSKVLHEENLKLATPTILNPFIQQRLSQRKVLIVFDDVNNFLRFDGFVKGLRFGLGSRIIITSRDKQVLYNFKVPDSNIHKVEGLNFYEALKLFSNHAFNQNRPTEDFMALSERMVSYANGNPLALRVLGSALLGMSKQEWESAVDDLQGIGDSDIFNVLKISYDRLNDKEKNLFLDIACFFNGHLEDYIIDCKYSLRVLINKSLITIEGNGIRMHDLLQEMGKEIVRRESPKNPGERSRLWKPDDVIWTLKKNKGTEKVEGISLEYSSIPKDEHLILSCQVFDKMPNLRFLLFTTGDSESNKVHLLDGLNSLPDELIILNWHKYPLSALPKKFSPKELVELDLSESHIEQLWEETEDAPKFPKLKWLSLSDCRHLIRIPNLTDFPLLEHIDLSFCLSLVEFPSSVQQLNKLGFLSLEGCRLIEFPSSVQQLNKLCYLSLKGCSNVTKFPSTSASIKRLYLSGTAIEEVPSSILSLTNLIELDLSGFRRLKHLPASILKLKYLRSLFLDGCSELETLPEISETMEILNDLGSSGTAITELSSSIEHLNGLYKLKLSNCENLEMLPSSICDLKSLDELDLCNCSKLDKLPENLGNLKSLKQLKVGGTAVGQLPSSIRYLENLEFLDCSKCRGLTKLPPLSGLRSLRWLYLKECNLMEIPEDIGCLSSLNLLDLRGNMFESLPKSIKHLSKLKILLLRDCNMLRSLTELPVALEELDASNCKQLCQALPDASEFKRCITRSRCDQHRKQQCQLYPPHYESVTFIFINCFNLDQKAVSNVFEESLKGLEEQPTRFSIFLPGTEIPEWFTYHSSGYSVNIPVLRQDLVNRKLMGFAICAVLGFEEDQNIDLELVEEDQNIDLELVEEDQNIDIVDHRVLVNCRFEAYYHHEDFLLSDNSDVKIGINSDHILLGYSPFSNKFDSLSQNLEKLFAGGSDCVDISFEIGDYCGVKHYAVHPIYAKPKEIIGATIEDIGETSGRRSSRSDDNEEEVEPHPKRFCTQPKLMLPTSNQNS